MTNIVATGISSKLTSSEKTAIRTNIDIDKGVRDYTAYVDSIFAKATLDLNFAKNSHRVYEALGLELKQLTTAVTTARSTTATYQSPTVIASAAINTPRITYDAATGNALGLLAEESRTNLCLWSEDFTNAAWTKNAVTVSGNSIIAPDNTLTADKLIEDTTTGAHELSQAIIMTVGVINALSVHVKAGERNRVRLAGRLSANWSVLPSGIFDLVAGTVVSSTGAQPAEITKLQNGWYRCTIYGNPSSTNVGLLIGLVQSGTTSSYTGDGTSGLFVWGAQVEVGSFPTSYIPTTTAQVTRSADQLSALLPATAEGTIYVVGAGPDAVSGKEFSLFTLSDGTQNNRVLIRRNASTSGTQFAVVSSGTAVANLYSTQKASGQSNKYAISWKLNQFLGAQDGAIVLNDTGGNTPVNLTQLGIGSAGTSGSFGESLNGAVERIVFIPRALTAAELQTITA